MTAGYECYRALSQSSSSDLMALKDGLVFRFEIKSAVRLKSGGVSFQKANIRAENVALFIHRESLVVLIPEIPVPLQAAPSP
jgi:hypothetical protein